MPQLRAWHVRQKPGTLPKAGENTKALDLNPGLFRVASVHVRYTRACLSGKLGLAPLPV